MGGESRYPVKIPSNQINNIKYYSSNSYSAPKRRREPSTFAITPLVFTLFFNWLFKKLPL